MSSSIARRIAILATLALTVAAGCAVESSVAENAPTEDGSENTELEAQLNGTSCVGAMTSVVCANRNTQVCQCSGSGANRKWRCRACQNCRFTGGQLTCGGRT